MTKVLDSGVVRDATPDEVAEIEARKAQAAIPVVPQTVTMRQATQALILAGLDDDVEAMLAAMPGTEGKMARAEWLKSQVVERNRPLVIKMAGALGLTDEQLDQLFITAASLE
jgi:hypothetical protein